MASEYRITCKFFFFNDKESTSTLNFHYSRSFESFDVSKHPYFFEKSLAMKLLQVVATIDFISYTYRLTCK